MKELNIRITLKIYEYEELNREDRELVNAACEATQRSYAPYSHFSVGAAARLADKTIVTGSNQENAAYPSGLCAERTTLFYANSRYPDQVMMETENRFKHPMRILLFGQKGIYELKNVGALLPLSFNASAME